MAGPTPEEIAAGRRAKRNLLWATLLFLGLNLGLIAYIFLPKKSAGPDVTRASAIAAAEAASPPIVFFTTIPAPGFHHMNGASREKLLPETMGGGVAFLDFDGDGHPDLLFINSAPWPWNSAAYTSDYKREPMPTSELFHNDGHGNFSNVTKGSGLDVPIFGMGVAVGDYDNDGLPDVLITGVGGNHLFHNEGGGKFRDVTEASGVGGSPSDWTTSAAFLDYDNDGRLDLFVCHYVKWSLEIDRQVNYQLPGIGRAYGPPTSYEGTFSALYHNEGGGKFRDVSARAGIQVKNPATGLPLGKALGVAPVDLDGDGFIDLIVANDTVQNFVFHNERNGTFKEIGGISGLALSTYGTTRGAMGIDAGRFQADNSIGISIGNFANEMTALYVARRDPLLFTDEAIAQGIGQASRNSLTFGVFFFDYDLDGWPDLLTVNGHIEPNIQTVFPTQSYLQRPQLFWNTHGTGRPGFTPVPAGKSGPALDQAIVGRGSAFADIDGDGDLDIILTQLGRDAILLRNDQKLGHHWIRFKLTGTRSNRDAIGAWIKIRIGNKTLSQQVMPTRGYLSQSELPVTFGLGDATRIDEVVITWPGGGTQKIDAPRIDQLNNITQPR